VGGKEGRRGKRSEEREGEKEREGGKGRSLRPSQSLEWTLFASSSVTPRKEGRES